MGKCGKGGGTWKNSGSTEERLSSAIANDTGIGGRRIKKCNLISRLALDGVRCKRPKNIPPDAHVNRKARRDLDVVLYVRSKVKIAKFGFQRKLAEGAIWFAEQEASKGVPCCVQVRVVTRRTAAKREAPAAILAFVIVLIRPANLQTKIKRVAAVDP